MVDDTLQESLARRTRHTLTAEQEVQRLTVIQGEIGQVQEENRHAPHGILTSIQSNYSA